MDKNFNRITNMLTNGITYLLQDTPTISDIYGIPSPNNIKFKDYILIASDSDELSNKLVDRFKMIGWDSIQYIPGRNIRVNLNGKPIQIVTSAAICSRDDNLLRVTNYCYDYNSKLIKCKYSGNNYFVSPEYYNKYIKPKVKLSNFSERINNIFRKF